jgi:hypothetical protein
MKLRVEPALSQFVVHCKRAPFDVYVGRPSKWGNLFSHQRGTLALFRVATRAEAISAYEIWIQTQPELMTALPELRGKVLGCWCAPLPCHAEVLARLAKSSGASVSQVTDSGTI